MNNLLTQFKNSNPRSTFVIEIIGALIILKQICLLLSRLHILLRKKKNLGKRYGTKSWAFITGSSEGKSSLMKELVEPSHLSWLRRGLM